MGRNDSGQSKIVNDGSKMIIKKVHDLFTF